MADADGGSRDQRFRPEHRLRHRRQFTRVFRRNFRSGDRYFTVLARQSAHAEARLGMAISIRAAGDATRRNRLKRLVRESFRRNRRLLPALDIVIMARPEAARAGGRQLIRSLETHWKRIAARCDASPSS